MPKYDDRNLTQRRKMNKIVSIFVGVWESKVRTYIGKELLFDMAKALIDAGYEVKK